MFSRKAICLYGTVAGLFLVLDSALVHAGGIAWSSSLDAAKIEAAQSGRLVLLHFWGPSCGPCRRLEQNVLSQPHVGAALAQSYVAVRINAEISPALASAYQVDRVPTDIILTPQGSLVATLSCPGTAEDYLGQLSNLAGHYRQQLATHNPAVTQTPTHSAYAGLQTSHNTSPQPSASAVYPAAGPAAQNQPAVPTAPSQPAYMNNPWNAPAQQPAMAAAQSQAPAAATAGRYQSAAPTLPANAMPQSYRNAQLAAAAQTSPQPAASQVQRAASPGPSYASHAQQAPAGRSNIELISAQLPPGSPPLAFDGCCAVSLKYERKWVPGDIQFGAVHRGRTYLFSSEAQRHQFLANPDAYSPVFSGIDPVMLLDGGQTSEGSRQFGYEYRGAFYLFASEETMKRFSENPDRYAGGVRQAMLRNDASGGTLRR